MMNLGFVTSILAVAFVHDRCGNGVFALAFTTAKSSNARLAAVSGGMDNVLSSQQRHSLSLLQAAAADGGSSSSSSSSSSSLTGSDADANILDERKVLQSKPFAIPPDSLIARAKQVLSPDVAVGTKDGGACLADQFEFCAAVVGPIDKKEYLNALQTFRLQDSFEISPNFYGFSVDPLQPNRVWFFNRVRAIHSKAPFLGAEASGKEIVHPPQVLHLDFNEQGQVLEYGFYTVDRRQGNTGGLGGAFGFMYGVGKPLPIPECQPYKPSLRFRLLQKVGQLSRRFSKKNEP